MCDLISTVTGKYSKIEQRGVASVCSTFHVVRYAYSLDGLILLEGESSVEARLLKGLQLFEPLWNHIKHGVRLCEAVIYVVDKVYGYATWYIHVVG